MKKIIKSKIFLCVIVGISCLGIGVYGATNYKASDVTYNADNGETMNVNDALNELYNKKNESKIIFVGNGATYTSDGSVKTIDLTSYEGYENLVLNENLFLIHIPNSQLDWICANSVTSRSARFNVSYSSSTGELRYTSMHTSDGNYYFKVRFKVMIIE